MSDKGWFILPDRAGDRFLQQQLLGLSPLFTLLRGASVLDIGCAEGLISMELARCGAARVLGVDVVPSHIDIALTLLAAEDDLPCEFAVADANEWEPPGQYDVVIALALLHKLRDPSERCRIFAAAAKEHMVIRLPPSGPVIMDGRSDFRPHHIDLVMRQCGFDLSLVTNGPYDEWTAFYRRI